MASARNWAFWQADRFPELPRRHFNVKHLLFDVVVCGIVLGTFVLVWGYRRRRRPRVLSFTSADMFIFSTAISVLLGYLVYLNRSYRQEAQLNPQSMQPPLWCEESCIAPLWLRSLTGERVMPSFTWRVSTISVTALEITEPEVLPAELDRYPYLTTFELLGTFGGSGHFPYSILRSLPNLKTLKIDSTPRLDDQDVRELAQLTNLRTLVLDEQMTTGLDIIPRLKAALPNCEIIDNETDW